LSTSAVHEPLSSAPPRKLRAWIPTLLWLCVLAAFSTDAFSAEHTGSVLLKILRALFGHIPHHVFQQIHFYVRKSAHFCSYGFLGALAFFSWRTTFPAPTRWTFRWSVLAVLLVAVAAASDEYHQSFIPSRTSSVHDVFLDVVGAFFFQVAIALWLRWRDVRTAR
jgi:VanZ family protein